MRTPIVLAGAALAVVVLAGVLLAPDRFPIDRYRHEAERVCMQHAPCASFVGLFQE
jgi:hypothetical protein